MTDERQQLHLLGQAIRSARETGDFTVEGLACAAGISSGQLQALEAGELNPDYELLLRLAACLSTPPLRIHHPS